MPGKVQGSRACWNGRTQSCVVSPVGYFGGLGFPGRSTSSSEKGPFRVPAAGSAATYLLEKTGIDEMKKPPRDPRSVVLGAVRRRRRLAVKEVAALSGVSEGTLSVYENGDDCPPSLRRLREINQAIGFDVEATNFLVIAVEVADGEVLAAKDPLDATAEEAQQVRRESLRHAVGDFFFTQGRLT